MSDLKLKDCSKSITIVTSEEEKAVIPSWFAEIVLMSHLWVQCGLVAELNKQVKVVRGRMGRYEVADFVLLLLAYGISNEKTLKLFYKITHPFQSALAALWDREKRPSASATSRFLKDVTTESVGTLRKLLLQDLLEHGIGTDAMGGLYDRSDKRHIIFDIDPTKEVARQRSVPKAQQYPAVRRRRPSCAPGYAGRKRGEVVRSRTTVQQAHTNEWLGSFGAAGNGDIWGELQQACEAIKIYLQFHELNLEMGLLRLDGAYGWARGAYICQQNSLGFLIHCSDYGLLTHPQVVATLANASAESFNQVDTGKLRQIYDAGFITWSAGKDPSMSVNARLIVAVSEIPTGKTHYGKRQGNKVYQLFVTSCSVEQLSAVDLISLYCGRGGFEQTLSQEDQEQDPDRWCSGHGGGQDFWQLICQWIWNARLRIGFAAKKPELRRTLWAVSLAHQTITSTAAPSLNEQQAEPVELIVEKQLSTSAPSATDLACGVVAEATGRGSGKFAGKDFSIQPDGTLKCPANKILRPIGRQAEPRRVRILYRAKASDCKKCLLASRCLTSASRGRRVSLCLPNSLSHSPDLSILTKQQNSDNSSPHDNALVANLTTQSLPLYWLDLPAASLRRFLPNLLRLQQVEINKPIQLPILPATPIIFTRDTRAHRRFTWPQRLIRNSASSSLSPWQFHIHGLPSDVVLYLNNISTLAA